MFSSRRKEALISEPYPCPECARPQLERVVETFRLADGIKVSKLRHLKCRSCGARFFDDEAMRAIRLVRERRDSSSAQRIRSAGQLKRRRSSRATLSLVHRRQA